MIHITSEIFFICHIFLSFFPLIRELIFFTFSYPCNGRGSIIFVLIFKIEILMDLHVVKSPESENHIFNAWSVCVSVISITQKQITAKASNLVFYICITYRCSLILYINIGQKLCVQGHTKEF